MKLTSSDFEVSAECCRSFVLGFPSKPNRKWAENRNASVSGLLTLLLGGDGKAIRNCASKHFEFVSKMWRRELAWEVGSRGFAELMKQLYGAQSVTFGASGILFQTFDAAGCEFDERFCEVCEWSTPAQSDPVMLPGFVRLPVISMLK